MGFYSPKRDNKSVGERTEAIVLAELSKVGYAVLIPFGENHRYDLVIEDGDGNFCRLQCKTGNIEKGAIVFSTASSYNHHRRGGRRDYRGQIDYFAVYSPELQKTYLVPVDHIGTVEGYLRIEPPKNGQEKNIRWAKDYEL